MRGVSIIVACYKAGDFLREAVESVRRLNPALPYEIIIVDDASNDKQTSFVLNDLSMAHDIKIAKQPCNQGQSAARNRALSMAKYDYIFPLDADDKLNAQAPGFFEEAVSRLERHPETIAVYSRLKFCGARHVAFLLAAYNERRLLLQNMIPVCGMFRRSDALAIGGYKEDLRFSEDWELWNALHADRFRHNQPRNVELIRKTHYFYRQHTDGQNVSERQRLSLVDEMAQMSQRSLELYDHHFKTIDPKEIVSIRLRESTMIRNLFRCACASNPLDVIEAYGERFARKYLSPRSKSVATLSEVPQNIIH